MCNKEEVKVTTLTEEEALEMMTKQHEEKMKLMNEYIKKDLEETQRIAKELGITEYGTTSLSSRKKCRRPSNITNSSRRRDLRGRV